MDNFKRVVNRVVYHVILPRATTNQHFDLTRSANVYRKENTLGLQVILALSSFSAMELLAAHTTGKSMEL